MPNPLDEKLARFEELERRLVDPETLSNPSQYTAVARERGSLATLATKYRAFKNLNSQIRETLEMLNGPDPEMRELAEGEIDRLKAERESIWTELLDMTIGGDGQIGKSMRGRAHLPPSKQTVGCAAESWSLDRIKDVKNAAGVTVNDVVLAMCAGALTTYLTENNAMPDAPLIAMVPVNLRTANDADGGNVASAVLCNLATNVDDPAQRLQVDDGDTRQPAHLGVDVPRQRQVEDDQRPALPSGHGGGHVLVRHHRAGRLGREVFLRQYAALEMGQAGLYYNGSIRIGYASVLR